MKITSSTLLACVLTVAPAMVMGQAFVLQSHVIGSGAVNGSSTNFEVQGTVGQAAIGAGTSTNFKGNWGFWYTLSGGGAGTNSGFFAQLGVLLEGAYAGAGSMNANLGSSLALSQPFTGAPWNYPGTESVASGFAAANPDVVDWVFVQVRETTPGPTAPPMSVAAERAGFVKTDGSVVDTNSVYSIKLREGSHSYTLTVTDNKGAIDATQITVTALGKVKGKP